MQECLRACCISNTVSHVGGVNREGYQPCRRKGGDAVDVDEVLGDGRPSAFRRHLHVKLQRGTVEHIQRHGTGRAGRLVGRHGLDDPGPVGVVRRVARRIDRLRLHFSQRGNADVVGVARREPREEKRVGALTGHGRVGDDARSVSALGASNTCLGKRRLIMPL